MEYNFNKNWIFIDSNGNSKQIDLPYDAMIHEKRMDDCLNGINSGYFPGGKYIYEKDFNIGEDELDKVFIVHFEAVYQNCLVSVNDVELCHHKYGYSSFDVNITQAIKQGINHIRVSVDNSLEPNCRWYSGSGIFRDVTLRIVDEDYINLLQVETLSYEPAIIRVKAETVRNSEVKVEISFREEKVYSGNPGEIRIENARLWDADHPDLYVIKVSSANDEKIIKYGIRKLEWGADKGLCINGREVLLRGGCIHHDHGVIGANEYYDSEYRRIMILKENGFNAIRMAHNQASEMLLGICDELGMYVMNEAFDGWYVPKTYHDYSRYFEECWKDDLRSMVTSSYNHSCVIMYSIGNEVSETASEKGVETCAMLRRHVNELDPSRPVTAGINVLLNVYSNMGMGVYKEKGEYQPVALKKTKRYREKKTGSAFFNAMAQKLGSLMFFMSKGKKGDKASKGAGDNLDILGLNYASSRYDEDVINYPDRMMVGSETMVADLPYNWERVKKYHQLVGDFVWSAWDYLGEACIGDWSYASYKGLPLLAGQGMIDVTGKPLAAMSYMQVVWGLRKKPYIALRPINHFDEEPHKGSWQFTNAIDSYSWQPYEGKKAVCEVYSQGDYVVLSLNGREIGKKKLNKFKALFEFKYASGCLSAKAYDRNGNFISESRLETAGNETVITLRSDKENIRVNELCYLEVEFTDKKGSLKPYVEVPLKIETTDNVELLGFGSALCKTDEGFNSNVHHSYRGRALAVIKGKEAGKAKVRISSEGYESVERELVVVNGNERLFK